MKQKLTLSCYWPGYIWADDRALTATLDEAETTAKEMMVEGFTCIEIKDANSHETLREIDAADTCEPDPSRVPDWKHEVANDDTRLGFAEWCEHNPVDEAERTPQ